MSSSPVARLRRPTPPVKEAVLTSTCPRCSGPVDPGDPFCPACGAAQGGREAPAVEAAPPLAFRCDQCGAEVRCDRESRSTNCPFCAAPYVVDIDPRTTGRQDPEFVLGFAITPDRAEAIYRDWMRAGGLFRPAGLDREARVDRLLGIYLPFWSFSMKADSRWSAQVGEHWYRTETYTDRDAQGRTVTKTRRVRETEWWPLEGGHHAYYSFYLVSGSKGLPQDVSEWIQPFQLLALKRYSPRYLAGWLSEEYSVAKEAALALSEREFRRREEEAVDAFLPGDAHRSVAVETTFSKVNSDLILLPVYLRSYRYRGRLYRTLINGQTGKIEGTKPVSAVRVALIVGLVAGLVILLVSLAQLLGGGLGR